MSTFRRKPGWGWPFEICIVRAACPNDVPTWAGVMGWHDAYMTYLHKDFPVADTFPAGHNRIRWKVAPHRTE